MMMSFQLNTNVTRQPTICVSYKNIEQSTHHCLGICEIKFTTHAYGCSISSFAIFNSKCTGLRNAVGN